MRKHYTKIYAAALVALMAASTTASANSNEDAQAKTDSDWNAIAFLPANVVTTVSTDEQKSIIGAFGESSPFFGLGWGPGTPGPIGGFGNPGPY